MPMIEPILVEVPNPAHPYGAKGVGEVNIVPPMAAIANAIDSAIHRRLTELPMSPPKIRAALTAPAPSSCARRHPERLAKTLAPVGPPVPPALRSARLLAVAALRAGPSDGLPGRAASLPTPPPCPRTPVHHL